MFKPIKTDDKILNSSKFNQDKITFNILISLINRKNNFPDIRIYSDDENCLLLNTDTDHPVIIWNTEDFNEYEKLYCFLNQNFSQNNPLSLMTKQSCYQFFQNKDWLENSTKTDVLAAYKCTRLNNISKTGYLDSAKPQDIDLIAQMLQKFYQEALPYEKNTFSDCLELAKSFVNYPDTHKVWKDPNGQIATIARIENANSMARIGFVFTLPEKRGYSYAKYLVHSLVEIALDMKLIPVLYANFQYEPSNKCYQAVGFELIGKVYSYNIKKTDNLL